MLVSSSLSLLTPAAAEMGFLHLSLVRFLLGFFHGFVYTPIHACWGNWAPPQVEFILLLQGVSVVPRHFFSLSAFFC